MPRKTPSVPVESLAAVTAPGPDTGASLRALRDRLAVAIDDPGCPPRDLAALSRQLTLVLGELDRLPASEVSDVDDLRAARAAPTCRRGVRRRRVAPGEGPSPGHLA